MVTADTFSLSTAKAHARFRLSDDPLAVRVGFSFAGAVLFLILAHMLFGYLRLQFGEEGFVANVYGLFNLGDDRSLSESFNHGMLFFASAMFLLASYESRSRLALFLVALFAFAWLDDSAQYHERMGATLVQNLNLPPALGLRAQDFGELLAWGLAAALLSLLAIWAYRGRRSGDGLLLRLISLPVAALLVCAVIFDMVHIVIQGDWAGRLLTVLEDGGEMLAVGAIATVALAVARNPRRIWSQARTHLAP